MKSRSRSGIALNFVIIVCLVGLATYLIFSVMSFDLGNSLPSPLKL